MFQSRFDHKSSLEPDENTQLFFYSCSVIVFEAKTDPHSSGSMGRPAQWQESNIVQQ